MPRPTARPTRSTRRSSRKGIEVLYDDRDERAGAKFAAMDLIGLPWQVDHRAARPEGRRRRAQEPADRRARERAAGRRCRPASAGAVKEALAKRRRSPASNGCSPRAICGPRRKEGFISVIAGFSFVGIMLGVATLIIVMAVMNGFRTELLSKILGFTGHVTVCAGPGRRDCRFRCGGLGAQVRARRHQRHPLCRRAGDGVVAAPGNRGAGPRHARGRSQDLASRSTMPELRQASLEGFDKSGGIAIGWRMAWKHGVALGEQCSP